MLKIVTFAFAFLLLANPVMSWGWKEDCPYSSKGENKEAVAEEQEQEESN